MTISQRLQAVQGAVDAGVQRLRVKDSQGDYRAAVTITVSALNSPNEIFSQSAARPDAVKNQNDVAKHFANMPVNHIRFVNDFVNSRGQADGIPGVTPTSSARAIVD